MGASKAISVPVVLSLQDGRTVTAQLVGDEHVSYYLSAAGEVILPIAGGTCRVATAAECDSLSVRLAALDAERQMEMQQIAHSKTFGVFNTLPGNPAIEGGTEALPVSRHFCPHEGRVRIPLILVEFPDQKFTFDNAQVDSIFNSDAVYDASPTGDAYYNYGSVAGYFKYCSDTLFSPEFEVYGPYTVSGNANTYRRKVASLITEAVNLSDGEVDFSQYDSDGDGYVDNVYVFYAGYGSNFGGNDAGLVWPCAGTLSTMRSDGKSVYRYTTSNELALNADIQRQLGTPRTSIGVLCHEFSHTLGLMDTYPTVSFSDNEMYNNQSMEDWDLMDNGENVHFGFAPTPYTAWHRALLGWTMPITVLDKPADITLRPWSHGGHAYAVRNDSDALEYYILENIPAATGWYRGLRQQGMLVTHVNWNSTAYFANRMNNVHGKPNFTLLPADGLLVSSYTVQDAATQQRFDQSLASDLYPLDTLTALTDYRSRTGTVDKPLTGITLLADGAVSFRFMGGAPLMGDVNGDGTITIADANAVVNRFLGISVQHFNATAADVNGDGTITIADANAIVNIFLGM